MEAILALPGVRALGFRRLAPFGVAALAFGVLFWNPATTLVQDWLNNPDAGHGLLLAPIAVYLGWQRGRSPRAHAQPLLGLVILGAAVILRYLSGLAAELFTMRFSLLLALAGLIVFAFGVRQILHWWLPALLLILSIPLPAVVLGSLALPLQFKASQMGAAMLESRHIPVLLKGNVIHLPGHSLFVTEACSGLRSLSSLIALGVLIGGMWLRSPLLRVLLVAAAIPIAMLLNGLRIFLTGFFVFFVDPRLGEGIMHVTEGWAIFVIAFLMLGGVAWVLARLEQLRGGGVAA